MRIINIVDNLEQVNFGIWNAAIATAPLLKSHYNVTSELWHPSHSDQYTPVIDPSIVCREINPHEMPIITDKENTIVVTHGVWRYPTRWGHAFSQQHIPWIYVPHGMLEPWSRKNKWLKKEIYFRLVEKRLAQQANYIRAVGSPEQQNLQHHF